MDDYGFVWIKLPGAAICKALVAAQKAAQAVAKNSINNFQRYAYASAEALIEEGRAALNQAGLALMGPCAWQYIARDMGDKDKGQPSAGEMIVEYLLVHESGEVAQFRASTAVIPEKGRPLDKAQATALTYSAGYVTRGLLMLPRVPAEEDADARNDTRAHPDQPKKSIVVPAHQKGDALSRLTAQLESASPPAPVPTNGNGTTRGRFGR